MEICLPQKNSCITLLLGTVCVIAFSGCGNPPEAETELPENVTRTWIGPEYWSNPLMNWQLSEGRIECTHGGWVNEVHSLTHQLKEGDGDLRMSAKVGLMDRQEAFDGGPVFAGFKFGAVGHRDDYRSNIYYDIVAGFAEALMKEPPFQAGITDDGRLVINSKVSDEILTPADLKESVLELSVSYAGSFANIRLSVVGSAGESASMDATIQRDSLTGNVALACHPLHRPSDRRRDYSDPDNATFWFSDWTMSGDKFEAHPEQTYGPILWTQYTLHNGVLNLMAFFVPMEQSASQVASLQVKTDSGWATIMESPIDPLSLTANFRVEEWDDEADQEYRVTYDWIHKDVSTVANWEGTIRKDPIDKDSIVLAGMSCSHAELFPNRSIAENLLVQDPDILYFAGDQVYETCGGYGIVVAETEEDVQRATLNYLGKLWLLGISFRDLLKDRPSVMIPDDHDVYSDDLWGKSGIPMSGDLSTQEMRCFGGYRMHPKWVNMVERTQMGHFPDPYDPTPISQGIGVYYTSLDVGGVSFALINDRKFKSAPGDVIDAMEPLFEMRGERNLAKLDVFTEEDFDTTKLDGEELTLLGARQLEFLESWGSDGKKLRAVLSQSPYSQPHHQMVADFDSNGWPQSGRNRALRAIRKANAVMIHGDLHFSTLVQQGIDEWEDAGWSFTLPALITGTRRAWLPKVEGENRQPGMPAYTGRFYDGWKNRMTVWAVVNPLTSRIEDDYDGDAKETLDFMNKRGFGYGIVRFNKSDFSVTFEDWPVFGEFKGVDSHEQYSGFPKTVEIIPFNKPE